MSLSLIKSARRKVVGTKETLKALEKGEARAVLVARDAESRVVQPVLSLSESQGIEIHYVDEMKELGRACGIKVSAAVAAVIEF
ncbi:MAG TPA: 50S ribosomal protein L7Ae-like protein [Firmicutes bacterium]|nr:50S ribosomal protein L7Ae-like protein [Bacillota bacterium]